MQDGDDITRLRALKVLITLRKRIEREPSRGIRKKYLRFHFRIDRLTEGFVESLSEYERTEVVDVGNRPEATESPFCVQARFLTALVDRGKADATIADAEVVDVDERGFAGTHSKFAALGPASQ